MEPLRFPSKRLWLNQGPSLCALTLALLCLAGHVSGQPLLTTLVEGGRVMAPFPAAAVVFLSVALLVGSTAAPWPQQTRPRSLNPRTSLAIARTLAVAAMAIALLTIVGRLAGLPPTDPAPKGLLAFELPWLARQMAPATATAIVLLSLGLLVSTARRFIAAFQIPAILAGIIGWFGFTSYFYGGEPLLPYSDMALPTTLCVLALSVGLMCARTDGGLMALLIGENAGGLIVRRVLLPAIIVPVVVGWLRLKGQQAGLYGTEAGLALFALSNVLLFSAIVWFTAAALARADEKRQEYARALGNSERRLQTVVDNISEGLVVSDLDGQLLQWNRAGLSMHDFASLDECRLRLPEFTRIFELSSLEGVVLTIDEWPLPRIFRGEQLDNYEVRIRRLDRAWERIFSYGGGLVREPNGRPLAFLTITDITERKRAEAALRESEEKYRRLIDEARDAFFSLAADQTITSLNPAFEAITGFAREDWLGRPFPPLIEPADLPATLERFKAALRGEPVAPFEMRVRRNGGGHAVLEFVASPFMVRGAPAGLTGIGRDVTARKQLEAQFRQAQKMESIGTLAGGIAHDFNNILAAISGYTELAKMSVHDVKTREYLGAVSEASTRATELVRQILAFSRQQQPQRAPLQLRRVVNESLKLLRASIPATIEFDSQLPKDTAPVLADSTQVHQVIMNLGTNAWHAMRGSAGRLTVRLEEVTVDRYVAATNPNLSPREYVRLSVSDTGCGMDRATVERIFEPFFTTKPTGEGTGLGLSVVHGIMQSHEGAVTVYSELGRGTTFHLYFPALGKGIAEEVVDVRPILRGAGQRVLFVDDEAPLALMGEIALQKIGYVPTSTTKPAEALQIVHRDPKAFDLLVTDFTMPGMTGVELAESIHRVRPDLPIIMMTGYVLGLTLERLRPIGVRELLPKPQTVEALAAAVHRVLHSPTDDSHRG